MTLVTLIPLIGGVGNSLRGQTDSSHLARFVLHSGVEPVGCYKKATIAVPIGYESGPHYHTEPLERRA